MKMNRDTFGTRLRLERERRGISLREIAGNTKIKESLFAEIERGDDSKWPQGIFRRAHMCSYLSALGLPVQPLLNEFLELFPDDPAFVQAIAPAAADPKADGIAAARPALRHDVEIKLEGRLWVALFDLSAICAVTAIAGGFGIERLWMAATMIGLGYFTGGSLCFGSTPGSAACQMIQPRLVAQVARATDAHLREIRMFVASRRDDSRSVDLTDDHESATPADLHRHQRASA